MQLNLPLNQAVKSNVNGTKVSHIKTIKSAVNSLTTLWIKDNNDKYKLKIYPNDVEAKNGFYLMNNVMQNGSIFIITNDTYYFNSSGEMVTGWIQTADNKWYFFENAKNGNEGKMALGWKKISDKWYYFIADGSMLVNSITPDGYIVGRDGAMIQ